MMYKDGEFKEGKSRSDSDMTKLGEYWVENTVLSTEEFQTFKKKATLIPYKSDLTIGNVEGVKRVDFE